MKDTIAPFLFSALRFLIPVAWVVFVFSALVLVPLSFGRRTGAWATTGLFVASYLFGATTWLASAALTLSYFGWFGLIIGLVFAGVGVFPLALWALFVGMGQAAVGFSLIAMLVVAIGARLLAIAALSRQKRATV